MSCSPAINLVAEIRRSAIKFRAKWPCFAANDLVPADAIGDKIAGRKRFRFPAKILFAEISSSAVSRKPP